MGTQTDISDYPILVVDDNMKNLQIIGKILKQEGYRVEFATDGENALEWIDQQDFNLILLDIMMPGMSGYEVCERIKQNEEKKDIPVIFLTSKTDEESMVKGFDLGAIDYVAKPFNKKELLARVSTQLKIKQSQRDVLHYLNDIENKNKLITYSLNYAKHIQKSIIQLNSDIEDVFPDYFVFFQPKDIVSGDFYWFYKNENGVIVAVMDCTGHGVPGAMLSMMGITLMNEIVKSKEILIPDQILNHLRSKFIESFGQRGIDHIVTDGMDGSVILFDFNDKKLKFSAANRSVYIARETELITLKGDRMPISFYCNMDDFTKQELSLEPGDMIYMFSDGYEDQFGGRKNKKFNRKTFGSLLMEIHNKSMNEQKVTLSDTFKEWKGDTFQVDDVTVIGIRYG